MRRNSKGFTLTETLLTITIIAILFALAVPAIFSLQKNLRQKELDDKAEIIYTAAQNRLTELYTSGRSDLYSGTNSYIHSINNIPGDFASDETYDEHQLLSAFRYVTSVDDLSQLLGEDTIDDSLKNGHYIIEIIPYTVSSDSNRQLTVPSVYAVYYSEDKVDVTNEYNDNSGNYVLNYRIKKNRLDKTDARVGYYGGSNPGSSSDTKALSITSVKIYSEDVVNRAVVKARQAVGIDKSTLTFKFVFSDEHNNSVTYFYYPSTNKLTKKEGDKEVEVNSNVTYSSIGLNYTFEFTMDNLSSNSSRFKSLFPELVAGDDITLVASASSSDFTVSYDEGQDIGNSIYATKKKIEGGYELNTAYISNPRHLQNLDSTSNVNEEYNKVVLLNDIDLSSDSAFTTTYTSYFNNLMSIYKINTSSARVTSVNVPCFKGIDNSNIISFSGQNHKIVNLSTRTGLFESNSNELTVKDLTLTGERVYGNNNAGGIVAYNRGNLTIQNVKSYLESNEDYPTSITSENYLESIRWIYGANAGGLVGNNSGTLNIESSFVSSVIGSSNNNTSTGGLVGTNSGSVTIEKSYADSYLYGKYVGGLVGNTSNSNINISDAYTAGFIGINNNDTSAISAGMVAGKVNSITNSYTIMAFGALDYDRSVVSNMYGLSTGTIESDKSTHYSTVSKANAYTNLYYKVEYSGYAVGNGVYSASSNLGDSFSVVGNSTPYKLMGTSLTSYNYHKLKNIEHYGDWSTNFISGSLVYYEAYDNGTYGFDGAGVDISLSGIGTIIGDGYGIAFDNKPTSNFLVNDATYGKDGTYFEVVKNGKTYYIYPLNTDTLNPTSAVSGYYSKVVIKASDNVSESKTYYYNPHFARTVVESDDTPSSKPSTISIRSPRHLYNLSLYYDGGYRGILENVTYKQERNMDYASYDWSTYFSSNKDLINNQGPIGASKEKAFNNNYDGGCYVINNVSFVTDGSYVGMFGYNSGTIKNVVIATQYSLAGNTYKVSTSKVASANVSIYYGILVGFNSGSISNSAVAGYYLSGSSSTIYGYSNSEIFIGGLVGYNSGTINSSSADSPKISLDMSDATCYAGGFVGYNSGAINNSYGINMIKSKAAEGNTNIAGFAGFNSGSISDSYCATALEASGTGSNSYTFAPNNNGGTARNCYYLSYGSFQFIDGLYSYNGDSSRSSGSPILYTDLKTLSSNKATTSLYNALTLSFDSSNTNYPFKAVVKDNNDNYIHYGEWQTYPVMGNFGLFYWEHEQNGNNDGYHITYLGSLNNVLQYQSTLCSSHDDSGVITEYGYGYYVMSGTSVTNTLSGLTYSGSSYNTAAKADLEQQFMGLTFYPYTTTSDTTKSSYLYLSSEGTYGTWTITYNGEKTESLTYKVNPFFGNAFSLESSASLTEDGSRFVNSTPGLSNNPFEIRSADQLQFINWNSSTRSVDQLVDSSNYKKFNFLMYTTNTATATQSKDGAGNSDRANLNFKMSHDINADSISNFTPIAGQNTSTSSESSYNATLYAWFGSLFDGQSYKIQELSIKSKSYTVGLFGVTAGAKLENIILYSTKGATIERETYNSDPMGAYAIGGLCGIAYDYNSSDHTLNIENCAVAGYQIVDNSRNRLGLGEANIGGLVGVSNISIDKCSAVTDIIIKCVHKAYDGNFTFARWGNFIRVGGISGAVQYKVSNSYSGGSIKVEKNTITNADGTVIEVGNVLNETYNTSYPSSTKYENQVSVDSQSKVGYNVSTNIFLSGIAGSGFAMNYQNFTGNGSLKEGYPTVENCYTYMSFPTYEGTIRSISMITSVADRYSNGTSPATIKNCYYLSSSADFAVNAPKYYFSNSNNTPYSLIESYKDSMITGNVTYLDMMFGSGVNSRVSISTLESKDYTELSTLSKDDLGESWKKVTDTENGQAVNGKYSFNAGNSSLTGKNYPFPTIITQNGTINVHYGTWPFKGSYWQKGSDGVNIFDYISDDKYAYVEYKFFNTENDELKDIQFVPANEGYCEVVGSTYSTEKDASTGLYYYTVKIKLLKTGSVDILAKWTQNDENNQESFNLKIDAELKVNVNPSVISLNRNESFKYAIKLADDKTNTISVTTTRGSDYTNKVTYSESHSMIGGDVPFATIDLLDKNSLSITGLGYNGRITVNANYSYNGTTYTASGIINVNTGYVVGIKGDSYNETYLDKDNNLITYYNPGYSSGTGPSNSNSTYFIYERNSDSIYNLIKNVTSPEIKLTDDDGNEIDNVEISIGTVETSSITDNTFNTRPITFKYYSFDEDSLTCNLNVPLSIVKINENDSTVITNTTLMSKVSIKSIHYVLSLNSDNDTEFKSVELVSSLFVDDEFTLESDDYKPTRSGYEFAGWYKTIECNDEDKVEVINKSDVNSNITLYAKWEPVSGNINFLDGDTSLGIINCEYDASRVDLSSVNTSKEHYTLLGFYDSNSSDAELVIDVNGNVVDNKIYNQMVLGQVEANLYAQWHVNPNLILNVNGDETKIEQTYNSTITSFEYSLSDTDKRIEGWYSDAEFTTKVADENGNILDEPGLSFIEDVTLYGRVMNTYNIILNVNGSEITTYKLDEGTIISINGYTKPEFNSAYSLIGWFDESDNEIFDANANAVDESGYNLSFDITLHAKFIKYVKADSFENGGEYVIVSNNYALTNQTSDNYTLNGSLVNLIINNNESCLDVNAVNEDTSLWKYQDNKLKIGDKCLYRSSGSLSYSTSSSTWNYSYSVLSSGHYYLYCDNGVFDLTYNSRYASSVDLYKKTITDTYYED